MPAPAADSTAVELPSRLRYDVVDVFTDRAFAGNPLAVVYGADLLSTAALQAITGEFNLSETSFPSFRTDGYGEGLRTTLCGSSPQAGRSPSPGIRR